MPLVGGAYGVLSPALSRGTEGLHGEPCEAETVGLTAIVLRRGRHRGVLTLACPELWGLRAGTLVPEQPML